VADVQYVKAAVGKDQPLILATQSRALLAEFIYRNYFPAHLIWKC
jgi:hypothetical protein